MRRQGLRQVAAGAHANGGEYKAAIRPLRQAQRRPSPGVLARRAGPGAIKIYGPAAGRRGATAGLPTTVLL